MHLITKKFIQKTMAGIEVDHLPHGFQFRDVMFSENAAFLSADEEDLKENSTSTGDF